MRHGAIALTSGSFGGYVMILTLGPQLVGLDIVGCLDSRHRGEPGLWGSELCIMVNDAIGRCRSSKWSLLGEGR